jgi:hypothetical protein
VLPTVLHEYRPLLALGLLTLSLALRRSSRTCREFAEHGRQQALLAVASGRDVTVDELRFEQEHRPVWLALLGWDRLPGFIRIKPAPPLAEYYSLPADRAPPFRQRLAYAESSFWTHALLRATTRIHGAVAVGAASVAFIYLYGWAISRPANVPTSPADPTVQIDTLFSIVIVVVAFRALDVYLDCRKVLRDTETVSDELLSQNPLAASDVASLSQRYDISVAQCPPIPDFVYRLNRRSLVARFEEYRASIGPVHDDANPV